MEDVSVMEGWRAQAERSLAVPFAWSWVVAYRSARVHAARDRLRYRVFREPDGDSPTGYRWTWRPIKPDWIEADRP